MNISYKWLKEYVDFDLTPQETADALTSVGLEVDGVEEVPAVRGGLKGLVTGHVLTCKPHPDSDHMHVCTVDAGQEGEPLQIVCGAPNVHEGQKVIVATIGTKLYDGDKEFVIKRSKLRGVESYGMLCAEDEIGVGTDHAGIISLPEDTPVGVPAATYFGLESDYVIEVDITPNRADACSHYGVARDLYAYLRRHGIATKLHRPDVSGLVTDGHALPATIEVADAEGCARYCALTLKGCEVKESPKWLQERLTTIGLRPINNVVDVTNYIMMAYGQPLHCFDYDMIRNHHVIVRTLPEGTPFVTLDGVEHKLSAADLAICDEEGPMCIAGILGGRASGTYDTTTDILLESAYFDPTRIRRSARRHGLSTDASFRFERGVDPDGQIYALKAAASLIKELTGCTVESDFIDIKARELPTHFEVELPYKYAHDLIGKTIEPSLIKEIVTSLEMKVTKETADGLFLKVPAYRVDVKRPCDVVEDILRIYGYNNVEIPTALKSSLTDRGEADRAHELTEKLAHQLVGQGMREILCNSLTREAYYTNLTTYPASRLVRLLNPLSSDLGVMRQTLLFGGLESIARNVARRNDNLMFFETGNVYSYDASRHTEEHSLAPYSEHNALGIWLTGKRVSGSWAHADEDTSVYQLTAYVDNLLRRAGLDRRAVKTVEGPADVFAKSLALLDRAGRTLAVYGLVTKAVSDSAGVEQPVYYAEINLNLLVKAVKDKRVTFSELTKFPAVRRDLALLIDRNIPFSEIERVARGAEKKLLREISLFDVYEGKNLPAGKKSYAVTFTLQDENKTMNDKQTDAIMTKIIASLKKQLGAELR